VWYGRPCLLPARAESIVSTVQYLLIDRWMFLICVRESHVVEETKYSLRSILFFANTNISIIKIYLRYIYRSEEYYGPEKVCVRVEPSVL
jgi:hypothetical protein